MRFNSLFKYAAAALALTLLSACGGGGGAPAVPAPAAPVATGQVAVWTKLTTVPGGSINVSIDGVSAGSITTFLVAPPTACGQAGTLTKTLPVGPHVFTAASAAPGTVWAPYTGTILANQCLLLELL